jgi:hypothetical protein
MDPPWSAGNKVTMRHQLSINCLEIMDAVDARDHTSYFPIQTPIVIHRITPPGGFESLAFVTDHVSITDTAGEHLSQSAIFHECTFRDCQQRPPGPAEFPRVKAGSCETCRKMAAENV